MCVYHKSTTEVLGFKLAENCMKIVTNPCCQVINFDAFLYNRIEYNKALLITDGGLALPMCLAYH